MEKKIRRKKIKTGMLHHKISKQGRLCPDLGQRCPFLLRPRGGQRKRNAGRIYTPGGCIIPVTWGAYSRLKGFIVACDRRPQGLISYKPLLPPRQMLTVSCSSTRPPPGLPPPQFLVNGSHDIFTSQGILCVARG